MSRRLGWIGGGILLLALVCLAGRHMVGHPGAADNPSRSDNITGGDGGGLPRATPLEEHVDAAALERVAQDPAAAGLAALVVMRDAYIVFERYGRGLSGDSMIDGGSFARALLALTAGIAAGEGLLQLPAQGFDPDALRAGIEAGAHQPYPTYLSHKLWSRLNASPASIVYPAGASTVPADCCVHARVLDWMRVAALLTNNGRFEGKQLLPNGWVQRMQRPVSLDAVRGFGVELPVAANGAEPFAVPGVFFLRGPQHWRLWLVPQLRLAVLFGDEVRAAAGALSKGEPSSQAWDETRLPNLIIGAITDRSSDPADMNDLRRLVPGH